MTAEEAAKQMRAFARAMRKQEVRNIMVMTGCDREEAERLQAWIASGGSGEIAAAGTRLGTGIGQVFRDAFRLLNQRT